MTAALRAVTALSSACRGPFGVIHRAADDQRPGLTLGLQYLDGPRAEETARSLLERMHLCAPINHPFVARIHGVMQVGGRWALVSDFIEGLTLESLLAREQSLPVPVATMIARRTARALHAAWDRSGGRRGSPSGIVHGDLSPAHIWVGRTTQNFKVLGLGILAHAQPEPRDVARDRFMFPGPYAAPESHRNVDLHASDVYAIAAVLTEMLTGAPPSYASTQAVWHDAVVASVVERVRSVAPLPGLDELIAAALNFNPEARPSARRFEEELERICRGAPGLSYPDWVVAALPAAQSDEERELILPPSPSLPPPLSEPALVREAPPSDAPTVPAEFAALTAGVMLVGAEPAVEEPLALDAPGAPSPPEPASATAGAAAPEAAAEQASAEEGALFQDETAAAPAAQRLLMGHELDQSREDLSTSLQQQLQVLKEEGEDLSIETDPGTPELEEELSASVPGVARVGMVAGVVGIDGRFAEPDSEELGEARAAKAEPQQMPASMPGDLEPEPSPANQPLVEVAASEPSPSPTPATSRVVAPPQPRAELPPRIEAPEEEPPPIRPPLTGPHRLRAAPVRSAEPEIAPIRDQRSSAGGSTLYWWALVAVIVLGLLVGAFYPWKNRQAGEEERGFARREEAVPPAAGRPSGTDPALLAPSTSLPAPAASSVAPAGAPTASPSPAPVVLPGGGATAAGLPSAPAPSAAGTPVEVPQVAAKAEPVKPEPPKVAAKAEPPKAEPPKVAAKAEPVKPEPPKVAAKAEPPKVESARTAEPSPAPAGTFVVKGDVASVRLVGNGTSYSPGPVPPGSYRVMVTFDGGSDAREVGKLQINAGAASTVKCSAQFMRCSLP